MLIGVVGLAGAGKSTVAGILVAKYAFTRLAFADPLKGMLKSVGFTDAQLWGEEKSAHLPEIGRTPRYVMQTLGTEWGRFTIHPDFWVRMWARALAGAWGESGRVVTDDVRFANEVRAIRDRGGFVVLVRSDRAKPRPRRGLFGRALIAVGCRWPLHPSERIDRLEKMADFVIDNDGTHADLAEKVAEVMAEASKAHAERRGAVVTPLRPANGA